MAGGELVHTPPDLPKIPGGWITNETIPLLGCKAAPVTEVLAPNVFLAKNVLSGDTCDRINEFFSKAPSRAPVTVQGFQDVKNEEDIGSYRTTMFNVEFAKQLTKIFAHVKFPRALDCDDYYPSDWWQGGKHRKWEYHSVSPQLRWMKYRVQGSHRAHFDAGYLHPNPDYRTLFSFVLYLSNNPLSGATRIIQDNQSHLPVWERNHDDWDREERPEEIIAESYPLKGAVLLFPHRACHSVGQYKGDGGNRQIIRGDLFFKKA